MFYKTALIVEVVEIVIVLLVEVLRLIGQVKLLRIQLMILLKRQMEKVLQEILKGQVDIERL